MKKFAILRAEKLKTMGNIAASLSHTFRNRPTLNADPARTPDNELGPETAEQVRAKIAAMLPDKRRSDAVLAVEYFVGASPEFFENNNGDAYFAGARRWLEARHGKENVVFSAIHRDETSPHMVAYVVPLDDGKLNAKKWLGGRAVLSAMQTDFAERVGIPCGLERGIEGSQAKHTTIHEFYALATAPPPPAKPVQIDKPPLVGRESWAAAEAARLTAEQQRVVSDAWAKGQALDLERKKRIEAEKTAKSLEKKLKVSEAEKGAFRREMEELGALIEKLVGGLVPEQIKKLWSYVDGLRADNEKQAQRIALEEARQAKPAEQVRILVPQPKAAQEPPRPVPEPPSIRKAPKL